MAPSALFVTTMPVTLRSFLLPFADSLRAQGWRVDAMANGAPCDPDLTGRFDALHDAGWTRDPRSLRALPSLGRRVREVVAAGDYDIVHVHTPNAAFATRYALRSVRGGAGPIVFYTAHGFHFYEGQKPLLHAAIRAMEQLAAGWTNHLVNINAEDHAAALRLGRIAQENVHLVPGIGVDCEAFKPGSVSGERVSYLRSLFDVPPDHLMVVMIAEMNPNKRHAFALETAEALRRDRVDATIVFVGTGPLEARLRDAVRDRSLGQSVQFAGQRPDIPDVLAAADLAMLVSEREGLPRSLLEAFASGVPAVGTATRGIADLVADPSLIAAKDDPTALAAIIAGLARDRERLAHLGAVVRERALAEYSLPLVIAEVERLYEAALAGRAPRSRGAKDASCA